MIIFTRIEVPSKLWDLFRFCYFLIVNDGQTNAGPRYNGLRNAMVQIVKTEGVRGLYRGVTPNVLGSGSSWGFYFFL